MDKKIDFVLTWVDDTDKTWQQKRNQLSVQEQNTRPSESDSDGEALNGDERYRDYGTLRYWFRAVEKYASWVNKVFLVTDEQQPSWLNLECPKLTVIDHKDILTKDELPTFNSNAIDFAVSNIPNLSEQFVLFDDDMFLTDYVSPEDFFVNGLPRDLGIFLPFIPSEDFDHIPLNDVINVNKHFSKRKQMLSHPGLFFSVKYGRGIVTNILELLWNKVSGVYNPHVAMPYLRHDFSHAEQVYSSVISQTKSNHFRTNNDVSHWLVRYDRILRGEFIPQRLSFGQRFDLQEIDQIITSINKHKYKVICVNDQVFDEAGSHIQQLSDTLNSLFPTFSAFEK